MKIELRNNFHNTAVAVVVGSLPARLRAGQAKRVERALCGIPECSCSGPLGVLDSAYDVEELQQNVYTVSRGTT